MNSFKVAVKMGRPLRSVSANSHGKVDSGELVRQQQVQALREELARAHQNGIEEGRRLAEQSLREERMALQAYQKQILARLEEREAILFAEVEAALPELILEGVRRVIGLWQPTAEQLQVLVRDMLDGLQGESGNLRVFLNPQDAAAMRGFSTQLVAEFPGLELVEDSHLDRGECYLHGRFGITDGRFATKLENLQKVMR